MTSTLHDAGGVVQVMQGVPYVHYGLAQPQPYRRVHRKLRWCGSLERIDNDRGNEIKRAGKKFEGKVLDAIGDLTSEAETQPRGEANHAVGATQYALGSAKRLFGNCVSGIPLGV